MQLLLKDCFYLALFLMHLLQVVGTHGLKGHSRVGLVRMGWNSHVLCLAVPLLLGWTLALDNLRCNG